MPEIATLRDVIDQATARHLIETIRCTRSLKEARLTLGISVEYFMKLRRRFGLKIGPARNRKQMKEAA